MNRWALQRFLDVLVSGCCIREDFSFNLDFPVSRTPVMLAHSKVSLPKVPLLTVPRLVAAT